MTNAFPVITSGCWPAAGPTNRSNSAVFSRKAVRKSTSMMVEGDHVTQPQDKPVPSPPLMKLFYSLAAAGALIFIAVAAGQPGPGLAGLPAEFSLFLGHRPGAVLFSALMHTVKARWSGPLADVAESFAAFFPVSLVLFVILFIGQQHVFPWLHEDLHGKEVWLNVPFMFGRDLLGLCLLYGFGLAFLYHRLYFTLKQRGASGPIGQRLMVRWESHPPDEERMAARMTTFGILYLLAFRPGAIPDRLRPGDGR
jgi:hypothetical protein